MVVLALGVVARGGGGGGGGITDIFWLELAEKDRGDDGKPIEIFFSAGSVKPEAALFEYDINDGGIMLTSETALLMIAS